MTTQLSLWESRGDQRRAIDLALERRMVSLRRDRVVEIRIGFEMIAVPVADLLDALAKLDDAFKGERIPVTRAEMEAHIEHGLGEPRHS